MITQPAPTISATFTYRTYVPYGYFAFKTASLTFTGHDRDTWADRLQEAYERRFGAREDRVHELYDTYEESEDVLDHAREAYQAAKEAHRLTNLFRGTYRTTRTALTDARRALEAADLANKQACIAWVESTDRVDAWDKRSFYASFLIDHGFQRISKQCDDSNLSTEIWQLF